MEETKRDVVLWGPHCGKFYRTNNPVLFTSMLPRKILHRIYRGLMNVYILKTAMYETSWYLELNFLKGVNLKTDKMFENFKEII